MNDISTLNKAWGIKGHLNFKEGAGHMPVIEIKNDFAQAVIALQGAHILSFLAKDEEELIWVSEDAVFASKKSVRGGVPICWPWFGAHASNTNLPSHGFARTANWKPIASRMLEDGRTLISLEIQQDTQTQKLCEHPLQLKLHITVGKSLEVSLETTNLGDTSFALSQALHTYFYISDVSKVHIEGLDDCEYLDKLEHFTRKHQHGSIHITEEVDRVYVNTGSQMRIVDTGLGRTIHIRNQGSASVVVWNPWLETASKMGDLGEDGHLNMLCVETANAFDDIVNLAAGASHVMTAEYDIQSISGLGS